MTTVPGQIMTTTPANPPATPAPPGPPALAGEGVRKTYRMGKVSVPVLRGASIRVGEGEWVAILGASGSGKSTLLHILGGLDRPDPAQNGHPAPAVSFRGRDLTGMSAAALDEYRNASVGFVFQFYHLLPELSVLENALLPAMRRHGRLGFARRRRELEDAAGALLTEFGLGHRLRHRPGELSGGERQRTAIARALINDPPVLLADEPTGNLDRKTGDAILDAIAHSRGRTGRTLVMVTHDPEVAARADRIVHLVDGQVVGG
jgi:lipoprotein-releasing system ATP-binding protein